MAQPADPQGSFEKLVVKAGSSTPSGYKIVDFQNAAGVSLASVTTDGFSPASAGKKYNWANDFNPRASTDGTNVTPTAGTIYVSAVFVPVTVSLTGVAVFNGSAVGTDKAIVALYNSAGAVLANSALAGTTCVGTDAIQKIAFTAAYATKGPELYFLSWSCNGTTARLNAQADTPGVGPATSQVGVFGTLDSIATPPTAFAADVGPIAATY